MGIPVSAPSLAPPKNMRFRLRMHYIRHLLKRAFIIRNGFVLREFGVKSSGCAYSICADGLGPGSIVYSGGVGKDVSFEHDLVKAFGCSVVIFDPSPIGLATMKLAANQNPRFRFFPVGLAGKCGTWRLAPPFTDDGDSWFSHDSPNGTIEVRCVDLATLMKENQHDHIDLVKIDIEGAEYGVIDQIVDLRIPEGQIIVEFHDSILPGIRARQSLRATFKLLNRGYKLISEIGFVDAFVHPKLLNSAR
jgi:FkbM family methyltransferase